jgi:potassium efflux system protein
MPLVIFDNFSESTLDFQLLFWSDLNQVSSLAVVRSAVRFKIAAQFKHHQIEMAFPQRDLNLKISRPVDVKLLP